MSNEPVKHRTEDVYDSAMSPIVASLIEVAKRERIPLLVSAGMIGPEGPMSCDTLILDGADAGGDPELAGMRNRLALAHQIIRGHSGFDTAASLMITKHHGPPAEPKFEKSQCPSAIDVALLIANAYACRFPVGTVGYRQWENRSDLQKVGDLVQIRFAFGDPGDMLGILQEIESNEHRQIRWLVSTVAGNLIWYENVRLHSIPAGDLFSDDMDKVFRWQPRGSKP